MNTITVQEFQNAPNGLLLDVRTPAEFEEVHAPDATLLPLSRFEDGRLAALSQGRPVYLLCRSGNRARQAAQMIEKGGIRDVSVIEGGMIAWEAAGLPVTRGRATLSLERQVRIVAGSLVLLGVILGFFVHSGLFLLSGFVGAGLIFAGITDTCGMGMILARMPWNNASRTARRTCQDETVRT